MTEMERDIEAYYERYGRDHERRRQELLERLPERPLAVGLSRAGWREDRFVLRSVLALAAGLMLVFGALVAFGPGSRLGGADEHAAWAAAMAQVGRVQSVHFKITTPGLHEGDSSTVEMWWRRPGEFRMVLPNGLVMTGNAQKRCHYDPQSNTLLVLDPGPGPEMFLLTELGGLFTAEGEVARRWVEESRYLRSEDIVYKELRCRRVCCEKGGRLYEYVIDGRSGERDGMPFYEVKEYSRLESGRLLSHLEVLEVNTDLPADLLAIEPQPGTKVVDHRTSK